MTTTHPTHVRIRNTDPNRRDCHAADAIVCRADRLADALLDSGWFAVLPDLIAPELQRALLAGRCTDGMERTLDIEIENLSQGGATLPTMTNTQTSSADRTPLPVGATSVDAWDREGMRWFNGSVSTTIEASGWLREDVRIYTGGFQRADGTCEWEIIAHDVCGSGPLTVVQARQIGEALIAAADELDALIAATVPDTARIQRLRHAEDVLLALHASLLREAAETPLVDEERHGVLHDAASRVRRVADEVRFVRMDVGELDGQ